MTVLTAVLLAATAASAADSVPYTHVELSPKAYGASPGKTAERVSGWLAATGAVLDKRVHAPDGVQDNRELGWAILTIDKIEGAGNFIGEAVFLFNTETVLKTLGKVSKKKEKLKGKVAYDVVFDRGRYASELEAAKKSFMPQVSATWLSAGDGMAKFGPWLSLDAGTDCAKLRAADKAGWIVECRQERETVLSRFGE